MVSYVCIYIITTRSKTKPYSTEIALLVPRDYCVTNIICCWWCWF